MNFRTLIFITMFSPLMARGTETVDCSEAYGGARTTCERTTCDEKYKTFIGTWSGPFESYERQLSTETQSVFRPFTNVVTYSEKDCLRNLANGDVFIVGRRVDTYSAFRNLPAKEERGLLITGLKSDGSPFLRTIDSQNGPVAYTLEYQNKTASLSIWSLTVPPGQSSPEMKFTTIDGQDLIDERVHKRNVTVTMTVGPSNSPIWEGVIVKGHHSRKK